MCVDVCVVLVVVLVLNLTVVAGAIRSPHAETSVALVEQWLGAVRSLLVANKANTQALVEANIYQGFGSIFIKLYACSVVSMCIVGSVWLRLGTPAIVVSLK